MNIKRPSASYATPHWLNEPSLLPGVMILLTALLFTACTDGDGAQESEATADVVDNLAVDSVDNDQGPADVRADSEPDSEGFVHIDPNSENCQYLRNRMQNNPDFVPPPGRGESLPGGGTFEKYWRCCADISFSSTYADWGYAELRPVFNEAGECRTQLGWHFHTWSGQLFMYQCDISVGATPDAWRSFGFAEDSMLPDLRGVETCNETWVEVPVGANGDRYCDEEATELENTDLQVTVTNESASARAAYAEVLARLGCCAPGSHSITREGTDESLTIDVDRVETDGDTPECHVDLIRYQGETIVEEFACDYDEAAAPGPHASNDLLVGDFSLVRGCVRQ